MYKTREVFCMKKEFEFQFPLVAETQVHTGLDLEKNQNKIKPLENLPEITIGFETDHKSAALERHNRALSMPSS